MTGENIEKVNEYVKQNDTVLSVSQQSEKTNIESVAARLWCCVPPSTYRVSIVVLEPPINKRSRTLRVASLWL